MKAPRRRAYRMTARADSTAETGRRILAATLELFLAHDYEHLTLRAVAERAGVTLQTVLRRYGSKEGLTRALGEDLGARIFASRAPSRPGDLGEAVRLLVGSFEEMGRMNWRLLRQEEHFPELRERLDAGRAGHRAWIEQAFAPCLPPRGRARERRILQLFAATDFYVWKLLRLDLGLSRGEVERVMRASLSAILADGVASDDAGGKGARRA